MKTKRLSILICAALALAVYVLPITSARAPQASPLISPLPTPTCGVELGCSIAGGAETCSWLLPDWTSPERWQYELIARHECNFGPCNPLEGYILTCWWDAPVPMPTVSPTAMPIPEAIPEPTPVPSTWQDVGDLWMGAYRMLLNERGEYCLPELAGCG